MLSKASLSITGPTGVASSVHAVCLKPGLTIKNPGNWQQIWKTSPAKRPRHRRQQVARANALQRPSFDGPPGAARGYHRTEKGNKQMTKPGPPAFAPTTKRAVSRQSKGHPMRVGITGSWNQTSNRSNRHAARSALSWLHQARQSLSAATGPPPPTGLLLRPTSPATGRRNPFE